jgi:hypothetical protein
VARKLIVEIIGDASSLERTFKGASVASQKFSHELSATVRGSVSATGVFKGLGRSLAFAGGGYIAAASVTEFIKSSVDAARDAGVAQRSLAAQMKASGQSFATSREAIDKASTSLAKFGFTSEDSEKALTVLERGTGSITRSIGLQGIAANLARAKNIKLSDAANVLAKVFGHQETALRRAVPGLPKYAHGMDLIRLAGQKLQGQAKANTTVAERFAATLHNTEVIIGTALLPVLNRGLTKLGDWLDKMNRTGRLQKDVNAIIKTATGLFGALKTALGVVTGAFHVFAGTVGGTKNALKTLAAIFVVLKARTKLIEWGVLSSSIAKIGTNAETSTGQVGRLAGVLGRLKGIGTIAVPIAITAQFFGGGGVSRNLQGAAAAALVGEMVGGPTGAAAAVAAYEGYKAVSAVGGMPKGAIVGSRDPYDTRPDTSGRVPTVHYNIPGGPDMGLYQAGPGGRITRVTIPTNVRGGGNVAMPLTPAEQIAYALHRDPNDVSALRQKVAFDQRQIAFLNELHKKLIINNKQWVDETGVFYDDIHSTQSTIAGIASKAASAAKAAANAAKAALTKAQRDAEGIAQAYLQSQKGLVLGVDVAGRRAALAAGVAYLQQFRASGQRLGLRPADLLTKQYADPVRLQLELARADATKNTAGTITALKAMRKAAQRALDSHRLSTQAQIQAWDAITNANQQLASAAGQTTKAIKFKSVSVGRAVMQLGLEWNRTNERRVAEFLATLGPQGKAPPGSVSSPLSGGITIQGDLNVVANDPQRLTKEVARQAKRSTVRRGSHGVAP